MDRGSCQPDEKGANHKITYKEHELDIVASCRVKDKCCEHRATDAGDQTERAKKTSDCALVPSSKISGPNERAYYNQTTSSKSINNTESHVQLPYALSIDHEEEPHRRSQQGHCGQRSNRETVRQESQKSFDKKALML